MQQARPDEMPEIVAFLRRDVEQAMLPLTTLDQYGMAGGHVRAVDVWTRRDRLGEICDVLAVNGTGLVLPHCPTGPWEAAAAALSGRDVRIILGQSSQVISLRGACRLEQVEGRIDRDEPYMTLSLDALRVPPGAGRIVPIGQAPRDPVMLWLAAYLQETLSLTPNMAQLAAIEDYETYCARGSHVVLMEGGEALSMTGFNAHQPDVVQIGGVYTPPGFRGLGLARRALALHLEQARRDGVSRAVLSAASPSAVRAYEKIGFRRAGIWSLCAFEPARRVGG